jgi:hypothetical protein
MMGIAGMAVNAAADVCITMKVASEMVTEVGSTVAQPKQSECELANEDRNANYGCHEK